MSKYLIGIFPITSGFQRLLLSAVRGSTVFDATLIRIFENVQEIKLCIQDKPSSLWSLIMEDLTFKLIFCRMQYLTLDPLEENIHL